MSDHQSTASKNLSERLKFMGLDDATLSDLEAIRSIIDREMPVGLDRFYDQVRKTPHVLEFFRGDEHINSAKNAQLRHWSAITAGQLDEKYMSKVQTIGLTHARIGLEPQWYIGGYALVLEHLIGAIISDLWPRGLTSLTSARGRMVDPIVAITKAVLLDMDIAISVYLEKERDDVTQSVGEGMAQIASKNLTYRLTQRMPEAYTKLQSDFNSALDQIEGTMRDVKGGMTEVKKSTQEILAASDDLARQSGTQAASLEQTAAALQEISTAVSETASATSVVRENVSKAKSDAVHSGEVASKAIDAMGRIESSSKAVSEIISLIQEITFQTNLLALNAGVEAARAGEAGRGFAVVASEVRSLAERSAQAAKEIESLVSTANSEVAEGVSMVSDTSEALERIISRVSEIDSIVGGIAINTSEQSSGLSEITTAMSHLDEVTQRNAAKAEQFNATSHSLAQESEHIMQLVDGFVVSDPGISPALEGGFGDDNMPNTDNAGGGRQGEVAA